MRDIAELMDHPRKEGTWAKKWFEGLTINAVTCILLSHAFLRLWIATVETLDSMASEGIYPK